MKVFVVLHKTRSYNGQRRLARSMLRLEVSILMKRNELIKRRSSLFCLFIWSSFSFTSVTAGELVRYNLDGVGTPDDIAPQVVVTDFIAEPGINEGLESRVDAGISTTTFMAFVRAEATNTSPQTSLGDDDYLGFRVSAAPGKQLQLSSLEFDFGASFPASSVGIFENTVVIQSSVDGINPVLVPGSGGPLLPILATFTETTPGDILELDTQAVVDLSDPKFQGLDEIEFRFTFADNSISPGVNRIDNVVLRGTVVPEPSTLLVGGLGCNLIVVNWRYMTLRQVHQPSMVI